MKMKGPQHKFCPFSIITARTVVDVPPPVFPVLHTNKLEIWQVNLVFMTKSWSHTGYIPFPRTPPILLFLLHNHFFPTEWSNLSRCSYSTQLKEKMILTFCCCCTKLKCQPFGPSRWAILFWGSAGNISLVFFWCFYFYDLVYSIWILEG